MNILKRINSFKKEYDYFEKDTYKSVFSAHHIIMDYYTQKRSLEMKCLDDIIDAFYSFAVIEERNHRTFNEKIKILKSVLKSV